MAEIPRRKVLLQKDCYGHYYLYDHVTGVEILYAQSTMEKVNLAESLGLSLPGIIYQEAADRAETFLDVFDGDILSPYDIWGDYPEVFELDPDDLEKGRYYG